MLGAQRPDARPPRQGAPALLMTVNAHPQVAAHSDRMLPGKTFTRKLWVVLLALAPVLPLPLSHAAGSVSSATATGALPVGFAAAAARIAPSVVDLVIIARQSADEEELGPFELFVPLTGEPAPMRRIALPVEPHRSVAAGFIVSTHGEILTSAHAVVRALEIWALLPDGTRHRAQLVGVDVRRDVALLKIDARGLPVVELALEPVRPGDPVAAMGAPFGFQRSLSAGIVSANPRRLHGPSDVALIQTDVPLNPGSSGGPLFNHQGLVVGMNSMIFSSSGIYVGVSFAVPLDQVLRAVSAIRLRGGRAVPDLGVRSQTLSDSLAPAFGRTRGSGALVTWVDARGAGAESGLRAGDVVLAVDRLPVATRDDLEDALDRLAAGAWVDVEVWRQGASQHLLLQAPRQLSTAAAGNSGSASTDKEHRLGLALASRQLEGLPPRLYVQGARGSSLLAGVEPGDRIAAVNATQVSNLAEFDAALRSVEERDDPVVALLVVRGHLPVYLPVPRRNGASKP